MAVDWRPTPTTKPTSTRQLNYQHLVDDEHSVRGAGGGGLAVERAFFADGYGARMHAGPTARCVAAVSMSTSGCVNWLADVLRPAWVPRKQPPGDRPPGPR